MAWWHLGKFNKKRQYFQQFIILRQRHSKRCTLNGLTFMFWKETCNGKKISILIGSLPSIIFCWSNCKHVLLNAFFCWVLYSWHSKTCKSSKCDCSTSRELQTLLLKRRLGLRLFSPPQNDEGSSSNELSSSKPTAGHYCCCCSSHLILSFFFPARGDKVQFHTQQSWFRFPWCKSPVGFQCNEVLGAESSQTCGHFCSPGLATFLFHFSVFRRGCLNACTVEFNSYSFLRQKLVPGETRAWSPSVNPSLFNYEKHTWKKCISQD